jgi:hypothetical protein
MLQIHGQQYKHAFQKKTSRIVFGKTSFRVQYKKCYKAPFGFLPSAQRKAGSLRRNKNHPNPLFLNVNQVAF